MKVWLLTKKAVLHYDKCVGKVVIAQTEHKARKIANHIVKEHGDIWTNKDLVTCTAIDTNEEMVVLSSF